MPEIVDTLAPSASPAAGIAGIVEAEILAARRAFATAQALLSGSPIEVPAQYALGWYDTSVSSETGSFALVNSNDPTLPDLLIGEIVRVTVNNRSVFAYVLDSADLTTDVALTRRTFMAICRPSIEAVLAEVAVIG